MNKENKLGMGLGALLSNSNKNNENNNGVQKINISQIIPNPSQPRKNFRNEELKELSSSIKNQGLIQPIIVKPITRSERPKYLAISTAEPTRKCELIGSKIMPTTSHNTAERVLTLSGTSSQASLTKGSS